MNKKTIVMFISITLILFVTILFTVIQENSSKKQTGLVTKFGIAHPPYQNLEERTFSLTHLETLGVDRMRTGTQWILREPRDDEFSWQPIEDRIKLAEEKDIKIFITLDGKAEESIPEWLAENTSTKNYTQEEVVEEYREYMDAFAKRFSNRIHIIQFGNEWDSKFWFPWSEEFFTNLTNVVYEEFKEHSPETTVVLGSFLKQVPLYDAICSGEEIDLEYPVFFAGTGEKLEKEDFLENCNSTYQRRYTYALENAKYDLVDVHMYDDYVNWPSIYNKMQRMVDVPVIVSEFGVQEGGFPKKGNKWPSSEHASKVYEALDTVNSLNVPEAYYFQLVDKPTTLHSKSSLIYQSLEEKEAYYVFQDYINNVS